MARRLDSWKEIAAHFGRRVRTVQRWEKEEGLPVHRLPHRRRATVFAWPEELDAWWASRTVLPAAQKVGAPTRFRAARPVPPPVVVCGSRRAAVLTAAA